MEFGDTQPCPLTPAMVELLQAAADNFTVKDRPLAERLLLAPSAVHTQFSRICTRLGVHNRVAALLVAIEHGWVKLPNPPDSWQLPQPESAQTGRNEAAQRPGRTREGRRTGPPPNAERRTPNPAYRGTRRRRRS